MSIMGDNPEFFDSWLEQQALTGRLGPDEQQKAVNGEFNEDYLAWSRLDPDGKLASEACRDYYEGLVLNAEERADRRKYES